jgi:hypothetical protein
VPCHATAVAAERSITTWLAECHPTSEHKVAMAEERLIHAVLVVLGAPQLHQGRQAAVRLATAVARKRGGSTSRGFWEESILFSFTLYECEGGELVLIGVGQCFSRHDNSERGKAKQAQDSGRHKTA